MAVSVHIPARISVDPGALFERASCLEEAFGAAMRRALVSSRKEVLEKRGGYLGVECHAPDFSWMGDGLDRVPPSLRAVIEERLCKSLLGATAEAAIYEVARSVESLPAPMSGDVSETFDDDRYSVALGLYGVPGYQGGGNKTPVKIDFSDEPAKIDTSTVSVVEWEVIRTGERFEDALLSQMLMAEIGPISSGYLGAIYKNTDGKMWLAIRMFPSSERIGEPFIDVPIEDLKELSFQVIKKKPQFVRTSVKLRPTAAYRLKFYAQAGNETLNAEAMEKFYGKFIRSKLSENKPKDLLDTGIKPEEYDAQLEDKVAEHIGKLVEKIPDGVKCFVELSVDGKGYLLLSGADIPPGLDIEVLPLSKVSERKKKKKAPPKKAITGGGAEAGEGKGGGEGEDEGAKSGGEGEGGKDEGADGQEEAGGGGFVYAGEGAGSGALFFPTLKSGETITLVCRPFLNEPSVDQMGADGESLRKLIKEIAFRLQIPVCNFAGQFCLNAAAALGGRAMVVGTVAVNEDATTKTVEVGEGNLGSIEFVPTSSISIQFMRHLAGVTSYITDLMNLIGRLYRKPEHFARIKTDFIDIPAAWQLRFHIELTDLMNQSVGSIFIMTCRVLLLQLLRSSKTQIESRINNFDAYAPMFEQMVRSQLTSISELLSLRDKLKTGEYLAKLEIGAGYVAPVVTSASWLEATSSVTEALTPKKSAEAPPVGPPGEVVKIGEQYFIRDSNNVLWSMSELETAIAIQRGTAESIDPLVKQITDIPDIVGRLKKSPGALRQELRRVLWEMQDNNKEMIHNVSDSWVYAFRASKIQEHLPSASIPGTTYALQGIHLQAHNEIGIFFRGSPYYASAIDSLFSAELGAEALTNFFSFTGLILLSILCPVAGMIVGAAMAAHEYDKALERERLYGSLIDPELVLTRAEVEADLFAAKLGLALSFIPGVGPILKGARFGVKAIARAGLKGGAKLVTKKVAQRISKEFVDGLSQEFATAFAREVVTDQVMDAVITRLLEPLMAHIQREATVTGSVGGIEGALKVQQMLELEKAKQLESGSR